MDQKHKMMEIIEDIKDNITNQQYIDLCNSLMNIPINDDYESDDSCIEDFHRIIMDAVNNNDLNTIRDIHLKDTTYQEYFLGAMNDAIILGHFEIIKFLNENRLEGCTKDAIQRAKIREQIEIVEYLKYTMV